MRQGRLGRSSLLRISLIVLASAALGYVLAGAGGTREGATTENTADATGVTPALDSTANPNRQVVAYYFHTTFRCVSCKKIEAYADEAIHDGFPSELADHRLVWAPINVEEDGNEHFVKDFNLYTKSLVIVEMQDGKIVRWKNLPKVWELIGNKPAFLKYVDDEVTAYLDGQS